MRSQIILLASAVTLLLLALLGGILGYLRVQKLVKRQETSTVLLGSAGRLRELLDPRLTPVELRARAASAARELDSLSPGEMWPQLRSRLHAALDGGESEEIRAAARELNAELLREAERRLRRAGKRTAALADNLLQGALFSGPVLAALAAGLLFATVYRPLRRAGRATSPQEAADAISGLSGELAALLRDLDAERRSRLVEMMRAGHLAALGTMAAGIAHEVRNPLMAVAGFAESARGRLERGDTSLDLDAELRRIEDEAHRAGSLLGDLLTLAPGEPQALEKFDVVHEAREAARLAAARSRADPAMISVESPHHLIAVGQPSRWRQLIFNLLTNAIDATLQAARSASSGAVRLVVRDEGSAAVIEVVDGGVGFPESHAGRLFEPFFSTKGRGNSGLGLFICEGLVREAGGTITARGSPTGRGACFTARIPRGPVA
jgi:C4-dicarboxylate-specific signal transduction histidine kinase